MALDTRCCAPLSVCFVLREWTVLSLGLVSVANVFGHSNDLALGARSEPGTGHLVVGGQRPNLAGFPPAERNRHRWTLCRAGVRVRRFASLYFSSDRNSRIPE